MINEPIFEYPYSAIIIIIIIILIITIIIEIYIEGN